jgi:hypothetical protein
MRCHRHPDRDATAICKHCTKGLCADCGVDGSGGTACGDECAAHIAVAQELLVRSSGSLRVQLAGVGFLAAFLMILGLGWLAYAVVKNAIEPLTIGMGLVCVLMGLVAYWLWRRFARIEE